MEVEMAIEYPSEYKSQNNWFKDSTILKVTDELSVSVPEYVG